MSKKSIIRSLTALTMLTAALGMQACTSSDQAASGSGSTAHSGMGQQVDPKTGTPLPGTMNMGY